MKLCLRCDTTFDAAGWRCPACGFEPEDHGYPAFAPELARSGDGYRPDLFDQLEQFERANAFWYRNRERLISWALERFLPDARSLLEVGCGTGSVLAFLRSAHPTLELCGCDAFHEGLRIAADRLPGVPLLQLDARRLPFDAAFDAIGSFDVIEHIEDDVGVLASMHRALRPGGWLLLTVPQHPWLWSSYDELACHQRRYTRRELTAKAAAAGFETKRVTSFVTLPLPGLALARLRTRRVGPEYEQAVARGTPAAVARILDPVLRMETAAIRRGWSPRLGSSMLLVARRMPAISGS